MQLPAVCSVYSTLPRLAAPEENLVAGDDLTRSQKWTSTSWHAVSVLALGIMLSLTLISAAKATVFNYTVDYFEVSGNRPGFQSDSYDGGPSVAPWGNSPFGTAVEAGGSVALKSPGLEDHLFETLYPGLTLDRSDIFAPATFAVANGAGDFSAKSIWSTGAIGTNGYEAMYLVYRLPSGIQHGIAMALSNFDSSIAALLGAPSGLAVEQATWTSDDVNTPVPQPRMLSFQITGTSIAGLTGDLYFQLDYNDSTDQATTSFSLDGGSTFTSPFTSIYFPLLSTASFGLGADPMTLVPEPSTALLLAFGLLGLAVTRRSRGDE